MKLDDAIEKRRSIRKFSDKKVRWDLVLEAIDATLKAPYAGNINNLKFVIVESQKLKDRLAECAQQDWIADASFVVVVCGDYTHLERMYGERCVTYARQHAGAAIENFLLKITDLKLGCCWVGAYIDEYIKEELGIPEHIKIEAILPVGYPKPHVKQKSPKKESLEKYIQWDFWGERHEARKKQRKFVKEPKTW